VGKIGLKHSTEHLRLINERFQNKAQEDPWDEALSVAQEIRNLFRLTINAVKVLAIQDDYYGVRLINAIDATTPDLMGVLDRLEAEVTEHTLTSEAVDAYFKETDALVEKYILLNYYRLVEANPDVGGQCMLAFYGGYYTAQTFIAQLKEILDQPQ